MFADWTAEDTYRQLALTALIGIDWLQTQEIVKDPVRYKESNPVLGDHPSMRKANLLIGGSILLCAVVAWMLPDNWRKGFQYIVIGAEVGAINNNYQSGIRIGGNF